MEVDKKATEVNFVRPRHERERDSALAVATLRQITVIQGILPSVVGQLVSRSRRVICYVVNA